MGDDYRRALKESARAYCPRLPPLGLAGTGAAAVKAEPATALRALHIASRTLVPFLGACTLPPSEQELLRANDR